MIDTLLNGRYRIVKSLGRGGFGQTFLAEDTHLTTVFPCVVKLLDPDDKSPENLNTAHTRFKEEITTLAKLKHPQIPQLLDSLEDQDNHYLVQEYIDGHCLSEELPPHTLCWDEYQVIAMLREVLNILAFVHQNKIIHRDIKPHNILRRRSDKKLVLIDFGAAKQITKISLNRPYTIAIGTVGYMPLEQEKGSPVFKSDVYALGVIAILALTGKEPHNLSYEEDTNAIIWHQLAPSDLSPGLKQLIDKMVYPQANRYRYSTLEALQQLEELDSNIKPNPTRIIQTKKSFPLLKVAVVGLVILSPVILSLRLKSQFNLDYQEAIAAYQKKDYKNALVNYDKVIKDTPRYYDAWLGKADTLKALKQYPQAIEAYDKAIDINHQSWQAWLSKADIYLETQAARSALKCYQKALLINASLTTKVLKKIAHLHTDLGEYPEAIQAFKRLLSKDYGSFSDWYFYAKVLYNTGDAKASLASYDKALERAQNVADKAQVCLDKGNILYDLKEYQEAVKAYKQAIEIQPDNYRVWYRQGKAFERIAGQEEAAIASYTKSLEINPSYFYAKRNLARLIERKKSQGAVEWLNNLKM